MPAIFVQNPEELPEFFGALAKGIGSGMRAAQRLESLILQACDGGNAAVVETHSGTRYLITRYRDAGRPEHDGFVVVRRHQGDVSQQKRFWAKDIIVEMSQEMRFDSHVKTLVHSTRIKRIESRSRDGNVLAVWHRQGGDTEAS